MQQQKLLILTSDKSLQEWRNINVKLSKIRHYINQGKGANFVIETKYVDVVPEILPSGRISHIWLADLFTPFFNIGHDIMAFHFSGAQRLEWGFKKGLLGSNPRTQDVNNFGDFYLWADEHSKRQGLDQFIQVVLHELCHEYFQHTGLPDKTHEWHAENPNIGPRFAELDWTLFQPERFRLKYKISILQRILAKWEKIIYLQNRINYPHTLQPLVERKAKELAEAMKARGHQIFMVEGYRTYDRQNALYAQGRTTPGNIVTNARGGESLHQYGVAVDFIFVKEGYDAPQKLWQLLGAEGKKLGFEWGGDWQGFVDRPHFELTLGHSLRDFQDNKVDYYLYK